MSRELTLDGGEITVLKKIGLSGGQVYGRLLTDSLEKDEIPMFLETLIGLIAVCGLRPGEALRLDRTDVDWTEGVLRIVGTKFNKNRDVPIQASTLEALGEYGVTLKILGTVRAPDRWAAAGELRKRLLAAFHANGIEIPRPQRVVLSGEPAGAASAAAPFQEELAEGAE